MPKPPGQLPDDPDSAAKLTVERADKALMEYDSHFRFMFDLRAAYRMVPEQRRDGRSNLKMPLAFGDVRRQTARDYNLAFGTRPSTEWEPVEVQDVELGRKFTDFFDFILDSHVKARRNYYRAFEMKNELGTCVLKTGIKRVKVPVWSPIAPGTDLNIGSDLDRITEFYTQQVVDVQVIRPWDCLPDPRSSDIQDMEWFVHRSWKTLSEIWELSQTNPPTYDPAAVARLIEQREGMDEFGSMGQESRFNTFLGREGTFLPREKKNEGQAASAFELERGDGRRGRIEILELWTNTEVITVADKKFVLRRRRNNPFADGEKPFDVLRYIKMDNSFWGMGAVWPNLDVNKNIDNLTNRRNDQITTDIKKKWYAWKDAEIDIEALKRDNPNEVVEGNMPAGQALQEIGKSNINIESAREIDFYMSMRQIATQIAQPGQQPAGFGLSGATATGANAIIQLQEEVQQADLNLLWADGLEGNMMRIKKRLEQFMPQSMEFRTQGELIKRWRSITRDEVRMQYDLRPRASFQVANKAQRKLEVRQLMQDALLFERVRPGSIDFAHLEALFTEPYELGVRKIFRRQPVGADPVEENRLFMQGLKTDVRPEDNHARHLREHEKLLRSQEFQVISTLGSGNHLTEHMQQHALLLRQQTQSDQAGLNSENLFRAFQTGEQVPRGIPPDADVTQQQVQERAQDLGAVQLQETLGQTERPVGGREQGGPIPLG